MQSSLDTLFNIFIKPETESPPALKEGILDVVQEFINASEEEFKKYSQKEKTDASASSESKYGMKQTVTETKIQENEALYQAFASGEFEYIICPVHGKQLVRKKKFRKLQ